MAGRKCCQGCKGVQEEQEVGSAALEHHNRCLCAALLCCRPGVREEDGCIKETRLAELRKGAATGYSIAACASCSMRARMVSNACWDRSKARGMCRSPRGDDRGRRCAPERDLGNPLLGLRRPVPRVSHSSPTYSLPTLERLRSPAGAAAEPPA